MSRKNYYKILIKQYYKNLRNFYSTINPVHKKVEINFSYLIDEKKLPDFRNNILSYFTGALNYPDINRGIWFNRGIIRHYFGSLKDLFLYKLKIKTFLKKNNIKFFDTKENLIGKPILYKFLFFRETGTNIYNNFLYSITNHYIKKVKPKSVLEIGSGFGKLASLIINNHKLNYTIIEYPGQALVNKYYLDQAINKKRKVNLVIEKNQISKLKKKNINIIPFTYCNHDSKIFYNTDLIINTNSFQHMSYKDINFYCKLIKKNNIKYIVSLNRAKPRLQGEYKFKKVFLENNFQILKEDSFQIKDSIYGIQNHEILLIKNINI